MSTKTASQSHGCHRVHKGEDHLGEQWQFFCECGYRTAMMINMVDAVTMFGLHCMDAAFTTMVSEERLRADLGLSDDRSAPRRHRLRFLRAGFRWAQTQATGPQAVPRHYTARFRGQ